MGRSIVIALLFLVACSAGITPSHGSDPNRALQQTTATGGADCAGLLRQHEAQSEACSDLAKTTDCQAVQCLPCERAAGTGAAYLNAKCLGIGQ